MEHGKLLFVRWLGRGPFRGKHHRHPRGSGGPGAANAALTALGSRFRGNDEMGAGINHLRARYPAMREQSGTSSSDKELPLFLDRLASEIRPPVERIGIEGAPFSRGLAVEQFRRRDLPTGRTRPGFAGTLRAMFFFIIHHSLARLAM